VINRSLFTICTLFLLLQTPYLQSQDSGIVQQHLPKLYSPLSKGENQQKLDSLNGLPDHYLTQIDSLLQAKAQLLESKISGLRSKTSGITKDLDSISNAQAVNFLDEKLDDLTPQQYTTKLNHINQSLETYKSKITDSQELTWVEHYSGQLDQLESVVKQYQGKLLNLEDLQALKGYGQQLQQLSQESSGYFKEVQDILSGGLSEDSPLMKQLESKIGKYPEFQELQKLSTKLEQARKTPEDYRGKLEGYQDKGKFKSKAKELVTKHFSQHQDKLQAAQQKLATFKKKYSSIQSTKDMSTAVKRNSLEGRPLSERLVLGGTFQVNPSYSRSNGSQSPTTGTSGQSQSSPSSSGGGTSTSKVPTSVDLSPLLGYRLNKKFTLGIGVTYRAVLDLEHYQAKDQVYGYRGFFQADAPKGFFLHGEYERMNTAVESSNTSTAPTDEIYRHWKSGALAGIGKEYSFVKGIKGQVMVLYDFLHEEGVSPYKKPWVIRFGFVL